jgi:GNAT superfamily N-acetyltransferase
VNEFTAKALRLALTRDPKLHARRFREIENAAISAYYDLFLGEIGQAAVARAVRLYYLFQPDCVTEEGRDVGMVECDACAYRLSEAVEHFLYGWYLYQHPEYEWTGFTESEARALLQEIGQQQEQERLERETYQIALFSEQ